MEAYPDLNVSRVKFINETEIYNEMQSLKEKILIFDLRNEEDFSNFSLPQSINLPYNKYNYEFFLNFNPENIQEIQEQKLLNKICKKGLFYNIIIFSNESLNRNKILNLSCEDIKNNENLYKALLLYTHFLKNCTEKAINIKGFDAIKCKYNFLLKKTEDFRIR